MSFISVLISHQAEDIGGVAVGHYLLHQYLEERKKLLGLKESRNRLLEQKVRYTPVKMAVCWLLFCYMIYL